MLQWRREAPANHVAKHVEDHDIGVIEEMVLFQQLHRLADHVAAATGAAGGPPASTHITPL